MASSLGGLSGHELLARLRSLARRGNVIEAELLAHLGEVEARRLFLEEACSNIFVYCQRVLHFSESVAYKRIHASRAAHRYPQILEAVRRGELHVTGVTLLAPQLSGENCEELLRAAKHKTAEEIRRLLADRRPKPDVKTCVRHVPAATGSVAPGPSRDRKEPEAPAPVRAASNGSQENGNSGIGSESRLSARSTAPSVPPCDPGARARAEPLGGERYCVRFTADPETHSQLQELRALMRHQIPDGDLGKILSRAVTALLEQVRKRKFGECSAPRPAKSSNGRPTRRIPASIRRTVWNRDGGRCTYVSPGGKRCGAREFLEFHHREPWARSRVHTISGIALRCRAHNQYEACQDFGEGHMERFHKRTETERLSRESACSGSAPLPRLDSDPDRQQHPRASGREVRTSESGRDRWRRVSDPAPGAPPSL